MLGKIVGRIGGDLAKITGAAEDEVAVVGSEAHLMKEEEEKAKIKEKKEGQKR